MPIPDIKVQKPGDLDPACKNENPKAENDAPVSSIKTPSKKIDYKCATLLPESEDIIPSMIDPKLQAEIQENCKVLKLIDQELRMTRSLLFFKKVADNNVEIEEI